MGWGADITEGLRPVVDLLYPPRCPLCGSALARQGGLCAECWGNIEVPGEPACTSCSRPLDSAKAGAVCWVCQETPPRHSGVMAATLYSETSRQLVLRFKHGGKLALAELMGTMMASHIPDALDANSPVLVPVPLHRSRLWERGFNQAALLAEELARRGKGCVLIDALVRRKRTPSLGGLGRHAREKALEGAITARSSRKAAIAGRDVILVDDVLTSGATSSACVEALLEAGAASVRLACFARVVDQ